MAVLTAAGFPVGTSTKKSFRNYVSNRSAQAFAPSRAMKVSAAMSGLLVNTSGIVAPMGRC
ncbi:hypothetical protein [Nonomuraea endophytica]|uniref:Uncharacterized protein n=1 Tax=Nonomuraea endophytica TaxID=714136 RepID=A0A7W7ZWF2_9ACTN|nr:hypothetical protein [Nonomuraea endophytica]MBB5075016.1 hypothetical protein [Nonomuraea endophytica]